MSNKEKAKKVNNRTRNWTFVVYPESAPKNWREIIDEYHVPWIESPLHDRDVDVNGELKKAHWHVLMMFDSMKSYDQIREITFLVKAPNPQKCHNAKGMVRYFAHLDNPEKFQYSVDDIVSHSGADIERFFELSKSGKVLVMKEIIEYIYKNKIDNYSDFLMICMEHSDEWFDVAINYNTLAINKMIDGIWQKNNRA